MENEKKVGRIELIIAIFLGITAVLTSWAAWQASLYGGVQATKYTQSTATIGEANSLYNEAAQYLAQDMSVWNNISELRIEMEFATENGDAETVEKSEWKLDQIMADNVGEKFAEAIDWADAQTEYASPFDNEEFINSYYEEANALYDEGKNMMKEGEKANSQGDRLGLVTVVYAVVLFLLGIAASFKVLRTKYILLGVSCAGFVFATVILCTVPVLFSV